MAVLMRLSAPIYQLKRRAKLLARNEKIALHDALDRVAREKAAITDMRNHQISSRLRWRDCPEVYGPYNRGRMTD
jgi:RNA polymerase-interacting CarD/CdnL/TRCF family regulator